MIFLNKKNRKVATSLLPALNYVAAYFWINTNNLFPFQLTISQYNPFTKAYIVNPAWNAVTISFAQSVAVVTDLPPGACMRVLATPYTQGVLSTTVSYANNFVKVTCGCPTPYLYQLAGTEPTGQPSDFTVYQVWEKEIFIITWTEP